jgi:hypothetical protein
LEKEVLEYVKNKKNDLTYLNNSEEEGFNFIKDKIVESLQNYRDIKSGKTKHFKRKRRRLT